MPYPPIEAYEIGRLEVSVLHSLYYEVGGQKDGKPVIFLHGGPGGGVDEKDRTYFDPDVYKIVLFDQRGAGRSTPSASIEENTTWDLVADIEKLREYLKVDKWVVFGGSWGSTLSLEYAQSHPDRVKALILRGIFALRRRYGQSVVHDTIFPNSAFSRLKRTQFLRLRRSVNPIRMAERLIIALGTSNMSISGSKAASHIFPEAWDEYLVPIPEDERYDMMAAHHKYLTSDDVKVRTKAAKAWSNWLASISKLRTNHNDFALAGTDEWALAFARIATHYFVNGGWMRDGQLLEKQSINKIRHIPTTVIQGRYDMVCPATTAYALKKVFPEINLIIVPDAGHSAREVSTSDLLTKAADHYSSL
ncbi:hypothetical protein FRB95_006596 [Tulasnella sp. JGI-2019a]|nr:hypothetical protein FRB95_006596 [Tulasnella sp. JGI-2019a]